MLAATQAHHSSGFCSDQSGFGVESVSGVEPVAATLPCSLISRALALVVETSIPRKRYFAGIVVFSFANAQEQVNG